MPKRTRGDEGGAPASERGPATSGDPEDVLSAIDIVSLPEDLLSLVLSKLDVAERARASRVCRKWRAAALQPPYSTELTLNICLHGTGAGIGRTSERIRRTEVGRCQSEATKQLRERGEAVLGQRAVLTDEATALRLLREPFCIGLQRLNISFVLPSAGKAVFLQPALTAISAVLPPTLVALSITRLGREFGDTPLWKALLHLDLARTAPCLEELELDSNADLAQLGLSHPNLKRLGANIGLEYDIRLVLGTLPRLEVVRSIAIGPYHTSSVANLRVRTDELMVFQSPDSTHLCLLKPGGVLRLFHCTLPDVWNPPVDLSELQVCFCILSSGSLESLLHRKSTDRPRLKRLVLNHESLSRCAGSDRPQKVIAALERVPGGTQIVMEWPKHGEWSTPDVVRPLMRLLATNTNLHRHLTMQLPLCPAASPDIARDTAEYKRARVAAVKAMGEGGKEDQRLLYRLGYCDP